MLDIIFLLMYYNRRKEQTNTRKELKMMNEKTKYEIYRQMFDRAQELRIKIEGSLIHKNMVYAVFVAVGDEEKNLYFVDVESAGGSIETYSHYRGMLTEEQNPQEVLLKNFPKRAGLKSLVLFLS